MQNGTTWAVRRLPFWYTQRTLRNMSWTKNPVISVQYRMCFVPLCSTVLSTCCFLLTRDRRRLLPLEILHNIPYPSLVTCTTVPPAVTLMLATYYAETQCYREYAPTRTNEGSENPE